MHPASTVNPPYLDQQQHYRKIIYGFVDRPACPECHEILKTLTENDQQRNKTQTRRCRRCRKKIIPIKIKIIEPLNLQATTNEYRKN